MENKPQLPRDKKSGRFKKFSAQDRVKLGRLVPADAVRELVHAAHLAGQSDTTTFKRPADKARMYVIRTFGDVI